MPSGKQTSGPFSLAPAAHRFSSKPVAAALGFLESLSGLSALNRVYSEIQQSRKQSLSLPFCDAALAALGLSFEVASGNSSRIPVSGPLLIVANHPTGAAEGLALESLVRQVRSDVKVLANHLLRRMPECRESSIFVDPFGGLSAKRANASAMRDALDWLTAGHALIVFPAGEVAHLRPSRRCVVESDWTHHAVRLARRTSASVLCVYFEGRNSALFQTLGLIHPRLRTAMLPRELLRMRGTELRLHIGTPLTHDRLSRLRDDREAAKYLRLRTLILGLRNQQAREQLAPREADSRNTRVTPIVAPQPTDLLESELAALPTECLLLQSGDYKAFAIKASQAPAIMQEIGRLREMTFRNVGEGTGRQTDLDAFDSYYEHLFVYDSARRQIVGAYRLGFTQDIIPRHGAAGLYTHSLFRYDQGLLDELGPSIELGRSFVTEEYQKSYAALLLLWKGIARMVTRRPQCRRLFGVVSISDQYNSMTKQLLMSFLSANRLEPRLSALITPRTPPRTRPPRWIESQLPTRTAASVDLLDDFVQEIEGCERSVPVLLRQYLSLNARVLGFNIDPAFGNVLDAMMVVDLAQVNRPVLDRFFGPDNSRRFLSMHCAETMTPVARA